MIDPAHSLPLPKQAPAPGISRGSIYYLPQPVSERDQALMNRIDRLHLDYPFAGARMRRDMLNQAGVNVGRKHVGTLMRKMGVEALNRKPKTTKQFCLDALEQAIEKHGTPALMTTDQGSQFTSLAFTRYLSDNGIQISMDGKGAWRDNVFVERLWRTVKYEHVYLHAYESTRDATSKIAHYFTFYNQRRPHSTLDRQTPDQVYFNSLPSQEAA